MFTSLLVLLSLACAAVPMAAYLAIMWWLDRYDREPLWMVGLTFAWGAVGAVFLALAGNALGWMLLAAMFTPEAAALATPVVVAPLVEEPAKALILLAVVRSRHFDNMTDGFVYGAAVGLGFGMSENFLYFSEVGSTGQLVTWAGTVVVRTLYSALMHAGATSAVGAALGWGRNRGAIAGGLAVVGGAVIAVGMHALWNGLLTWDAHAQLNGQLTLVDLAVFPVELAVLFAVFQAGLWSESRVLRRELRSEAETGLLPMEHVAVLSSALRRATPGWLPKGVPRGRYIRAATTLAFRRQQVQGAPVHRRVALEADLHRLREEVAGLLSLPAGRR